MTEDRPEPQIGMEQRLATVLGVNPELILPPILNRPVDFILLQPNYEEANNITLSINWGLRAAIGKGLGLTPEEFLRGEGLAESGQHREFLRRYSIARPESVDDNGTLVPPRGDESLEEMIQGINAVAFDCQRLETYMEAIEEMAGFIRRAIRERLFLRLGQHISGTRASREMHEDRFTRRILEEGGVELDDSPGRNGDENIPEDRER